jgi:hypothetical protein
MEIGDDGWEGSGYPALVVCVKHDYAVLVGWVTH